MALILADRVQETSTTTGTGTLALDGAVSGYQTFSAGIGNGNTCYYTIQSDTGAWEVGIGTVGAGTLARTTLISSSTGSAISFSGTLTVFVTYPAEKAIYQDASGNTFVPKLGATTPSTGAFTTASASTSVTTPIVQATNSGGLALKNSAGTTQISMGAGGGDNVSVNVSTSLNGTNAQIDISPTGTGHVHIKPSGAGAIEINPTFVGTIDNMTIGATTPKAITGTTITGTSFVGSGASLTGVVTSVTGTAPVVSSGGTTPAISMAAATATVNGYLTSTDWSTFNSKGSGTVTSVSGTAPITSTGGATPTIAMPAATASVNGYLTSADWTTFNSKGVGTVTSVSATAPITSTGGATPTIAMPAATTSANGYLTSTDWNTFNNKQSGNGPAFSAYANAVTSVANVTFTKIAFQVEEFDTNNNFDSTTNYRFTPTVAGYYQISSGVELAGNINGGVAIVIYKNGSAYKTGSFYPNGNVSPIATVSSLVYFNGSTDYVEIYAYQASGISLNTVSGIQFSWFNGAMIRGA